MAVPPIMQRLGEQKLDLLVEIGDFLRYASDRQGLGPLRDAAFQHPDLLDGADVALKVVGLAAAYFLIFGKAGRVYAGTMTTAARAAFREEGIEHEAHTVTKKLPEKLGEPTLELDALSKEAVTPLAFIELIKRRGL